MSTAIGLPLEAASPVESEPRPEKDSHMAAAPIGVGAPIGHAHAGAAAVGKEAGVSPAGCRGKIAYDQATRTPFVNLTSN